MYLPGRHESIDPDGYRYGFNGKELDDEIKGQGAQYDYGFRIYDSRLGRFLSQDPLFKGFPYYTPYQYAGNKPIWAIDLDGLEEGVTTRKITITNFEWHGISNPKSYPFKYLAFKMPNQQGLTFVRAHAGEVVTRESYPGAPTEVTVQNFRWLGTYSDTKEVGRVGVFSRLDYSYGIPATADPPKPVYAPVEIVRNDESKEAALQTETNDTVNQKAKEAAKAKSKNTSPLKDGDTINKNLEGLIFPYPITGIEWEDRNSGDFPARSFLLDIVEKVNASPNIKEIKVSGVFYVGDSDNKQKAKNSFWIGTEKLRLILKQLGLRDGVRLNNSTNNIKVGTDGKGIKMKFEFNE